MLTFIFVMFWVRATLPRMRVDRLMNFAWKYLVPLSIVNILIAGVWYEMVIRPGYLTLHRTGSRGFVVTAVLVVLTVYLVFLVNRKASARVALGSEWPSRRPGADWSHDRSGSAMTVFDLPFGICHLASAIWLSGFWNP